MVTVTERSDSDILIAPLPADVRALASRVRAALRRSRQTVAVAETTAGGLLASLLGGPGAVWFAGGVIAYSTAAKLQLLEIAQPALAHGAVSGDLAVELARSARRTLRATWGIGETGIAGPQTGRRSQKPAGLVFIAVSGPVERVASRHTDIDDRSVNQRAFAAAALQLLDSILLPE